MRVLQFKQRSVLPGFGLTLGYTMLYLSLIVLLPLAALVWKTAALTWPVFWGTVSDRRVVGSYILTFGAALIGATIDAVFGLIVAWTLVRYRFPGRRVVDALVDLPFALPTAVSGIAMATLYAPHGWLGRLLAPLGIKASYTGLGVVIAMAFIGLPFVVRTLQAALQDLDVEVEEAARTLGAKRAQVFVRVILPAVLPALITGFGLAFARAVGEYGSVIFIAGNMPPRGAQLFGTEVTSLLIYMKLDSYNYAQATAIAVTMLGGSFLLLLGINLVQGLVARRYRGMN
jgi:sulfate transport system permease protein